MKLVSFDSLSVFFEHTKKYPFFISTESLIRSQLLCTDGSNKLSAKCGVYLPIEINVVCNISP